MSIQIDKSTATNPGISPVSNDKSDDLVKQAKELQEARQRAQVAAHLEELRVAAFKEALFTYGEERTNLERSGKIEDTNWKALRTLKLLDTERRHAAQRDVPDVNGYLAPKMGRELLAMQLRV